LILSELEGQEEAVEVCLWGQIAGYLTHLDMEEDLQVLDKTHLVKEDHMGQEECSLQIMDQDQAICFHRNQTSVVQVSQAKEALVANLSDQAVDRIQWVDQEEEEAVLGQAEAAWAAALVHQEEALAEAVALEVDLVVSETTEI
jgi:hypothetical protein